METPIKVTSDVILLKKYSHSIKVNITGPESYYCFSCKFKSYKNKFLRKGFCHPFKNHEGDFVLLTKLTEVDSAHIANPYKYKLRKFC